MTVTDDAEPMVVKETLLGLVVCAPKKLSARAVQSWVSSKCFAGTSGGWQLSKEKRIGRRKHPARCVANRNRLHWVAYC